MYTTRKQAEKLLASNIDPESADMMVIAGKGKDPFKNWNPIPKTIENCKKYLGKDCMPAWSDDALCQILPAEIKNSGEDGYRYEFRIVKRQISGRGVFVFAAYFDREGGPCYSGFLSPSMTNALVLLTVDVMYNKEANIINYKW